MNITDMESVLREAKAEINRADLVAGSAARIIVGRLKHVPPYVLVDLKRELRRFNMHTRTWNDK
jgi:hypothetical protein